MSEKEIWKLADDFLNKQRPTEHNLALMDLGAMVCLPKNPKCELCPFIESCKGKDTPELFHQKKTMKYENKKLYFGVSIKDENIAMIESKGMLELPQVEIYKEENLIGKYKHSITRFKIEVYIYRCDSSEEHIIWMPLESLRNAPISSMTKKAIKLYEKSVA